MFGFHRRSLRRRKHEEILSNVSFKEGTSPRQSVSNDPFSVATGARRNFSGEMNDDADAVKAYIEKTRIFVSPTPKTRTSESFFGCGGGLGSKKGRYASVDSLHSVFAALDGENEGKIVLDNLQKEVSFTQSFNDATPYLNKENANLYTPQKPKMFSPVVLQNHATTNKTMLLATPETPASEQMTPVAPVTLKSAPVKPTALTGIFANKNEKNAGIEPIKSRVRPKSFLDNLSSAFFGMPETSDSDQTQKMTNAHPEITSSKKEDVNQAEITPTVKQAPDLESPSHYLTWTTVVKVPKHLFSNLGKDQKESLVVNDSDTTPTSPAVSASFTSIETTATTTTTGVGPPKSEEPGESSNFFPLDPTAAERNRISSTTQSSSIKGSEPLSTISTTNLPALDKGPTEIGLNEMGNSTSKNPSSKSPSTSHDASSSQRPLPKSGTTASGSGSTSDFVQVNSVKTTQSSSSFSTSPSSSPSPSSNRFPDHPNASIEKGKILNEAKNSDKGYDDDYSAKTSKTTLENQFTVTENFHPGKFSTPPTNGVIRETPYPSKLSFEGPTGVAEDALVTHESLSRTPTGSVSTASFRSDADSTYSTSTIEENIFTTPTDGAKIGQLSPSSTNVDHIYTKEDVEFGCFA